MGKLPAKSLKKDRLKDIARKADLIDLSIFPPNLRKLGKHILKHGIESTIKDTCELLEIPYSTVLTQIWRAKKNGNDFNKFLEDISISFLDAGLIDVDKALYKGAVSGSTSDRKLFYERTGRLKKEDTTVNINILSVASPVGVTPPDVNQREQGVIDAEILIPDEVDDDKFT
ncbi:MAG: hypothetical protein GTO02_04125 [Candidatus Dadabacteria bacterium]|nr:hypothetical protein [Candidatus Dadabacteria bacterium]